MVRLLQLELRGLPIEALRSRLWWPDGAGAAAAGGTGDGGSREAKWGAQAAATGKVRIVCKDAQGKKLSKATAKRRRQKAFPLNFGA